jgi:hypothetical protein
MKKIALLLFSIFTLSLVTSCTSIDDGGATYYDDASLLLNQYDLWEVDHSRTTGSGQDPFIERAITLSFYNGVLYGNNNFSGFGYTGNGYGIDVGIYNLGYNSLTVRHDVYGTFNFQINYIGGNTIQLIDRYNNVSYVLNGYNKAYYDYDYVFYNNIQYFLQEFQGWRKVYTSATGTPNTFDNENFLKFDTQGNIFYSSYDNYNMPINQVYWDYNGIYSIGNTNSFTTKTLTLRYSNNQYEDFYLTVINDNKIKLQHTSGTTYEFEGNGYIQFLRPGYKTTAQLKSGK